MELREAGHDGEVVLFAEEPEVPYERPPLSKGYLQGEDSRESTYVQARSGTPSTTSTSGSANLSRASTWRVRPCDLETGATPFDRLLIATGARPRTLDLASTDAIDVRYLRTLTDSTGLRERLGPGRHLLVLGGGWIGMEVAASARTLGTTVTVVEPAELPMLAALGADVAARFAECTAPTAWTCGWTPDSTGSTVALPCSATDHGSSRTPCSWGSARFPTTSSPVPQA